MTQMSKHVILIERDQELLEEEGSMEGVEVIMDIISERGIKINKDHRKVHRRNLHQCNRCENKHNFKALKSIQMSLQLLRNFLHFQTWKQRVRIEDLRVYLVGEIV